MLPILFFLIAVAVRAFFAASRSALINMRRSRLLELEQKGDASAQVIQRLTENSGRLLATSEVGAILGLVFAAGLAAVYFDPSIIAWIGATVPSLAEAAQIVGFILTMLGTGLILFVLGRLVPEAIAIRHSERLALWVIQPMQVISVLLWPLVRFAVAASNWLSVPLGGQKRESTQLVTEAEIKTMVDAGEEEGLIEVEEKEMILSVLDFGDTVAREVMVPRIDIVGLEVETHWNDVVEFVIQSGHSRVPVYRETIDDIIGILYAKDVLKAMHDGIQKGGQFLPPKLDKMLRKVYFTPESKRVSELLQELQKTRVHVSIVVDEYGGTAGLVTIEDILEEIVGEIQDEYDTEEPEYIALTGEKGYVLDAGMLISDANELLGITLPEQESDTIGGFIYDQLGKVPVAGEIVRYDGLIAEVLQVSDRRILKIKVTYEQPKQDPEDDASQPRESAAEPQRQTRENRNGGALPKTA